MLNAFRWTGGRDQDEDPPWAVEAIKQGRMWFEQAGTREVKLGIQTRNSTAWAEPGDWIVMSANGSLFPQKADVFEQIFEACGTPERTPFMERLRAIIRTRTGRRRRMQ